MYSKLQEKFSLWFKKRLGILGQPVILPFRGYGNGDQIYLEGRLMEDKGIAEPEHHDSKWENMLAMLKRYISDDLPAARVEVRLQDQQHEMVTNDIGIFKKTVRISEAGHGWIPVQYRLLEEILEDQGNVHAQGECLIPSPTAEFGVISDVDDTIMVSHSIHTIKKLRLMLTKNARTRLPFEGVDDFYSAMHKGGRNPFFYVSSSEWNLYDLLVDFCHHHDLPKGPFLLKQLKPGLRSLLKSGGGRHDHKRKKIIRILNTYPDLNFIMVGDSGQQDPEIYSSVAREHPERIMAIYIRDVTKNSRDKAIVKIAENLNIPTTEMLLIPDTSYAMKHARERGWIN